MSYGTEKACHWFNGDWIVQTWNTKLVLKVKRGLGAVTQMDWVVNFPKKHCYTDWRLPTWSIFYNCCKYGFNNVLRLALRHKPMKIDSGGMLDTDDMKTVSKRYIPEDEWSRVGLSCIVVLLESISDALSHDPFDTSHAALFLAFRKGLACGS